MTLCYAPPRRPRPPQALLALLALLSACSSVRVVCADRGGVLLKVSGRTDVSEGDAARFILDGRPYAEDADANGLVLTGLPVELSDELSISVQALYSLSLGTESFVTGFSDHHFRPLFNLGGVVAVLHGDRLWVGCAARARACECVRAHVLPLTDG